MSALTEKIAAEHHVYGVSGFGPETVACSCDRRWLSNGDHAVHVSEVTESAVRESIATEIERAVTSPLYPTHPNVASPNGRTYMSGVAAGVETARIIARTPTKET